MQRINDSLTRGGVFAPTILRITLGGIMAWHGYNKFANGIAGVEGFFASVGVPAPEITAPAVAVLELVGGLALVAGIATRLTAAVLAVILAGAVLYVKADLGIISSVPMPGAELDLALIAGLVAVMLLGPGRVSADRAVGLERTATVAA